MRIEPHGGSPLGPVRSITLGGDRVRLQVVDLGASVQALWVVGGDGTRRNVALGHADQADRLTSTAYLGGTIGRYANRIAGGRFEVDGTTVQLGTNDRGHHLHGGPDGFDRRLWEVVDGSDDHVRLRLESPDGDQGYPGRVVAEVVYRVDGDTLDVTFAATTDAPTVVGLTSHAYLNLEGEGSGSVDGHVLRVAADRYLSVDATGIPLGAPAPVDGTPFDLRAGAAVGERARADHPQVRDARGLDHCLLPAGTGLRPVATLESSLTRTRAELSSDQPGLQVYTGNFLDGSVVGTSGRLYRQGDGIALEPQALPDSPHRDDVPSPVLRPGDTYRAHLRWRFSALE